MKAELRDEWTKHEHDFEKLRAELAPVRRAVGESAKEVGTAVRLLLDSVLQPHIRQQTDVVRVILDEFAPFVKCLPGSCS